MNLNQAYAELIVSHIAFSFADHKHRSFIFRTAACPSLPSTG